MMKLPIADRPRADHAVLKGTWMPDAAAPKRWLGRATEPHILFPAIAILVLAVIWGFTLNLIKVERDAAERAAAISTRELAAT